MDRNDYAEQIHCATISEGKSHGPPIRRFATPRQKSLPIGKPVGNNAPVTAKTRIAIVDDHRILRDGLRSLLEREEDFSVIGEAGDGRGALACINQTAPDILVLDHHLPDENGLQITGKVVAAQSNTKVIILSANLDEALIEASLQAGAVGFLCKEETSAELVRAIRTVVNGQTYLSPQAATILAKFVKSRSPSPPATKPDFSKRELEVLKWVVEGLRNKEIADRLGISIKSVESYRARVMTKAKCSSPAELVRFALKKKLVNP